MPPIDLHAYGPVPGPALSGSLCAWANAWLRGAASADDVLRATAGGYARSRTVPAGQSPLTAGSRAVPGIGPDGTALLGALDEAHGGGLDPAPDPLIDVLARWRRGGSGVRAALPIAGDVRGVTGPATFRQAALVGGQALSGGGVGLVPLLRAPVGGTSAPPELTWLSFPTVAAPPDPTSVAEAANELSEAIRDTASTLAAAQVARQTPESARALAQWRADKTVLDLPRGFPPRAVALIAQAERLHALLTIVAADPTGGAVDREGIRARDDALRPLVTAVRRARVAGYNALTEPTP